MTTHLVTTFPAYAAHLREFIQRNSTGATPSADAEFDTLARSLFALQFEHNLPYRQFCQSRSVTPQNISHWSQIPAVPTSAFKELELTCLPAAQRTHVFHSSGTTEQRPSRHFHSADSLALYEASLIPWFQKHLLANFARFPVRFMLLPPMPGPENHSSLIHMFKAVRNRFGTPDSVFFGKAGPDGEWTLDLPLILEALRETISSKRQIVLLGTAFNFVHLLDALRESGQRFQLPPGSRVMETGGYKGRSRTMPKAELHQLITEWLGIPAANIVCEYGMSELSSQAYDSVAATANAENIARAFHFPPWARAQIISPETGREVGEGETGLIRIFDLANVQSVMAIQTEDLGVKRGSGFELLGRAALSEPRGCSLQSA